MNHKYHEREWLTEIGNSSTPTVVSFAGEIKWGSEDKPSEFYMIEISSCHEKIRLHKTADQTDEDWIKQVWKLHTHVGKYLEFLRTQQRLLTEN